MSCCPSLFTLSYQLPGVSAAPRRHLIACSVVAMRKGLGLLGKGAATLKTKEGSANLGYLEGRPSPVLVRAFVQRRKPDDWNTRILVRTLVVAS